MTNSWGYYLLTEEDIDYEYEPFDLSGKTDYHPIQTLLGEKFEFDRVLKTTTTVYNRTTNTIQNIPMMHVKFSPLLDPIRYSTGKYDLKDPDIRVLATAETPNTPFPKLCSPHNAAYVDSLFCYLSNLLVQKHGFVNGIECYGISSAIQKKYKMNIGNDLEFIKDSAFFRANLKSGDPESSAWFIVPESSMEALGTSTHPDVPQIKPRIQIDNETDVLLDDVEEIAGGDNTVAESNTTDTDDIQEAPITVDDADEAMELVSDSSSNTDVSSRISLSSEEDQDDLLDIGTEDDENEFELDVEELDSGKDQCEKEVEDDDSAEGSLEEVDDLEVESEEWSTDEGEGEDEGEDEDYMYEPDIYMYVRDFPVQLIFMEKFEGTLDELLINEIITDEQELSSAFMQVIMTLLTYKRAYGFTHNDLHTSNIMYKSTDHEYLYYIFNGTLYKVPTYGRIFTLIDFGRAIYKYKGHIFCSDSFEKDGDAYTQYNTEPFFNPNKARIDPNPSFDLCRLGCSLYDIALDGKYDTEELNEYQKTVFRWCQDDSGRNILYKSNGEERYPNFKSYKMIARIVHAHTPEAQLEFPFFRQWVYLAKENEELCGPVMNIDLLEPM
jgi:hypothetical protein